MFTQPLMYTVVNKMKPVRDIYRQQLLDEGIQENELKEIDTKVWSHLEDSYKKSKNVTYQAEEWQTE